MSRQDILEATRDVMARTFRLDRASITEDTRADDVLRWDSLNHLTLVLGLEKRFNTALPAEPMRMAQDVRGVVDLIVAALNPSRGYDG
jgi:acyl carrier protein